MKMTKTDFNIDVNGSSSWIVYITRTEKEAHAIHTICMAQAGIHTGDWYYHVSTCKIISDCRVPAFFHNRDYWVTAVEHNNGDWNKAHTYTLYIVE